MYIYLSKSESLVESRNPFANGLLSIFNFVIWKEEKGALVRVTELNKNLY